MIDKNSKKKVKDKLITTAEAAKILGRTRQRVVQLIKRKELPASKFGRDYLIRKSIVETFELKKPTGRPKMKGM